MGKPTAVLQPVDEERADDLRADSGVVRPSFEEVYEQTVSFVLTKARRLGVEEAFLDDVMQEVFVAVYRRLGDFEGRSSVKTWVSSILVKLVQNYRRRQRRKGGANALSSVVVDPEEIADPCADPAEVASRAQARRVLKKLLAGLTDEKAFVFVMVELEGMTVAEVAKTLNINVNTVSSRLRVARSDFSAALARMYDPNDGSEREIDLSAQARALLMVACSVDEPSDDDARRVCESVLTSVHAIVNPESNESESSSA